MRPYFGPAVLDAQWYTPPDVGSDEASYDDQQQDRLDMASLPLQSRPRRLHSINRQREARIRPPVGHRYLTPISVYP